MKQRPSAEWARLQSRNPARSAVQRLNDEALEYAILGARLFAGFGLVALVVWMWGALLIGDWRWWVAAAIDAVATAATGWFGWWQYANEEWRGDAEDG